MSKICRPMLVAATMAALVVPTVPAAHAGAWVNAIESVRVSCGTGGAFHVDVTFTHKGQVELRVMEYATATAAVGTDSDHLWFSGSGRDTFRGRLRAPGPAYIEAHMLKRNHRTHSLYDVAPMWGRAGPYSC